MDELEKSRLEDFKRILTYRIVTKIVHDFRGDYELYYKAPRIWAAWRGGNVKYTKKIYELIIKFNNTALTKNQVKSVFGRDGERKWLNYAGLVESDPEIRVFNKGTICMNGRRFQLCKRYQLPYEFVKAIFSDKALLEKVKDAGSDYYTDRQRRLIFTQINKADGYHYKTKAEIADAMTIDELVAGIDL